MRSGLWAAAVLVTAGAVRGEIFSYECDSLPVEGGWTEFQAFCDPVQWVEDGRLVQHIELCTDISPPSTQSLDYFRLLDEYIGVPTFFVEWRMVTDGDQTGIPFGVPAGLAAWSDHGVNYHFVVAKDRIRFLRDNTLPVLFFDFASEIPHRFRLELIGDQSYAFYIDDELMDTGVPEGPFPIPNPGLNISTRARTEPTTTAWDYIRYGEIPEDGSGDFDSSGVLDLRDFYFVHECVIDGGPGTDARRGCHFADMDFDGDVDLNDFATFQTLFGD